MKQRLGLILTAAAFTAGSLAALAAPNADLINAALNQNLEEREQVTGTYRQNEAASRPEVADTGRSDQTRIKVEIESGIASSSPRRLRDYDSSNRVYRDLRVEAHLDKELKAVDRDFQREWTAPQTNPNNGG